MACSIQITAQLTGTAVPGSGNVQTLQVGGTADGCEKVVVSVENSSTSTFTPEKTVTVNATGEWSATFSIADGDFAAGDFICGRNDKITVHAECETDSGCKADLSFRSVSHLVRRLPHHPD